MKKIASVLIILLLGLVSCTSLKPYQKAWLADDEMSLNIRKSQRFERAFHVYREGASGANGGKAGGGCGCN